MVRIKKILVPTDLSERSLPAIAYAISLAKEHAAEVTLLHVLPRKMMEEQVSQSYVADGLISTDAPIGTMRQPNLGSIIETKQQILNNHLHQMVGPELLKGLKISPLVRFGKTVDEIVAAAKEEKMDLIVITNRGPGFRNLFRGSLTERIARHAPCPVLMIQLSAEVRTEKDTRVPVRLIDKWAA